MTLAVDEWLNFFLQHGHVVADKYVVVSSKCKDGLDGLRSALNSMVDARLRITAARVRHGSSYYADISHYFGS